MKKIFVIISLFLSILSHSSYAQYSTHSFTTVDSSKLHSSEILTKKNIFSINPLALIVGGLELGYENVFTTNKSYKVVLGYYSATDPWPYNTYNVTSMEGFKAELQYRAHLEKESIGGPMSGLYVGGFFQYRQISLKNYDQNPNNYNSSFSVNIKENVNASALYPGVLIGYQLFLEDIVFFDINLGGGIIKSLSNIEENKKADISVVNQYINGVVPRLNFSIGFPF